MSDLSVLNIAQKIEESTDRIVESVDRLTAAVLASGYRHSLTKIHLNEFLDAYNFLQDTKGDAK